MTGVLMIGKWSAVAKLTFQVTSGRRLTINKIKSQFLTNMRIGYTVFNQNISYFLKILKYSVML